MSIKYDSHPSGIHVPSEESVSRRVSLSFTRRPHFSCAKVVVSVL